MFIPPFNFVSGHEAVSLVTHYARKQAHKKPQAANPAIFCHPGKNPSKSSSLPAIHGILLEHLRFDPALMSQELLIARIHCERQYLLLRGRPERSLDPGHWHLPMVWRVDASAPPHPALCGFPSELAASLKALLSGLGLGLDQIMRWRQEPDQHSPPWHPAALKAHVLDIELRTQTRPLKLPKDLSDSAWASVADWEDRFSGGQLLLNPLSRQLLRAEHAAWQDWIEEEPLPGLKMLPVRSNTLPPASHTNAFLLGQGPTLLVDPSPADEAAYQDLLDRLGQRRVDAIFLTHHHPDHHQQAPRLARQLDVPIWCSTDTLQRVPSRFGANYFAGVTTRTIADGEALGSWQGEVIRAHAVPGHDRGQLALAPESRAWMIVGDLIQGIGTVVIAAPEGDMSEYFATLQWVIDQEPAVIIPSHGQAMGSSFRIAETLRHRRLREQQVLSLHRQGQDLDSMLETIYAGVDRRLWGLARLNIESHLRKLSIDGKL